MKTLNLNILQSAILLGTLEERLSILRTLIEFVESKNNQEFPQYLANLKTEMFTYEQIIDQIKNPEQ